MDSYHSPFRRGAQRSAIIFMDFFEYQSFCAPQLEGCMVKALVTRNVKCNDVKFFCCCMYQKFLLFVCFYVITYSFDSCFLIEELTSWGMYMTHTLLFWIIQIIRCIVGENFHSDLKYSVRHANAFGKVYVVRNERLLLEYWRFLLRVVTVQQRAQHSCMSCEALNSEVRSANAAAIGSKLRKAASSSATFSKPHLSLYLPSVFFFCDLSFVLKAATWCMYISSCFHRVNTVQLQYIRVLKERFVFSLIAKT